MSEDDNRPKPELDEIEGTENFDELQQVDTVKDTEPVTETTLETLTDEPAVDDGDTIVTSTETPDTPMNALKKDMPPGEIDRIARRHTGLEEYNNQVFETRIIEDKENSEEDN